MATENLHPLDELKRLDQQVEEAKELAELRPIFHRLEEIAKEHSGNFEVQLVVGDVKQHVVNRGTKIKADNDPLPDPPPLPATFAPPPPPAPPGVKPPEPPTVVMKSPLLSGLPDAPPAASPREPTPTKKLPEKLPEDLTPKRLISSGQFAPPGQPLSPPPASPPPVPPAAKLPPPPAPPVTARPPAVPPPAPPQTPPRPDAPTVVLRPGTPKSEAPTVVQKPGTKPPVAPGDAPTVVLPPGSLPGGMGKPGTSGEAGLPPYTAEAPVPSSSKSATPGASMPPVVPVTGGPGPGGPSGPGGPPNQPPTGNAPPPRPNWTRALGIGAAIGLLLAAIGVAAVWYLSSRGNDPMANAVAVDITTTPAGASIRVNGEPICTSNCTAQLAPGTYEVMAVLDGYEPATSQITVQKVSTGTLNLALIPQPVSLRILADLEQGSVILDGQPAGNLQDGQFVVERVTPGPHTVSVTSGANEASLSFEIADAQLPVVTGPMNTRELLAVAVASFANQARVSTSSGPMKLAVNGQEQGEAGPDGLVLANYQPGIAEMVLGEGSQQRTLQENFGPAPMLTVFLKSDANIGTLIVATGESDVRVFLNNREYARRTSRGQLRIQTIGRVTVRVAKDGFEEVPPKTVTVTKGSETRVAFAMRSLPAFSTLDISNGTPGAEVAVDGDVIGTLSPSNGSLRNRSIEPGQHTIELRRSGYQTKRLQRTFQGGQTITLAGQDAILTAERTEPPPPPPAPKSEPPPPKVTVAPKPRTGTIANFDMPEAWRQEEGVWRHRGEAHLTYSITPPNGVFAFTIHRLRGGNIFRAGRVRWMTQYKDERNYSLYEMDDETFWSKVVQNGKTLERIKVKHNLDKDARQWSIQVDLSPQAGIIRAERNGEWVVLDRWVEPGRNFTDGKFGIQVNGNDEVGLSDFRFTGH